MKNKTGFLGTVYGVNIYADTKDDAVLKQISKYLDEQRRALIDLETQKAFLQEKIDRWHWWSFFTCVLVMALTTMFIWF